MTQKTITCNTAIEAEGLRARLMEEGIESLKYDETNSKVARGVMDSTIDVMVREEDYDKAKAIYEKMLQEQNSFMPWCPDCGSENVELLSDSKPNATGVAKLLASCISLLPFGGGTNVKKYRCKDCGKVFEHQ